MEEESHHGMHGRFLMQQGSIYSIYRHELENEEGLFHHGEVLVDCCLLCDILPSSSIESRRLSAAPIYTPS
jgi:hypothetical protein